MLSFKEFYEQEPKKPFNIPIAQLIMTKEEIAAAVSNISRGYGAVTEGPLEVNYHETLGKYQLTNGYHRLVHALMSGQHEVTVFNDGPATWRPPAPDKTFVPDWDEEYFGMEDFIEYYELKRLF